MFHCCCFPHSRNGSWIQAHPNLGDYWARIWQGILEKSFSCSWLCTFKVFQALGGKSQTRHHLDAKIYLFLCPVVKNFTWRESGACFLQPSAPPIPPPSARRWGVKGGWGGRGGAGTAGDNYSQSKALQKSSRKAGWGVLPGWIIEVIWAEATGLKY